MLVTPKPFTDLAEIWYLEVFRGAFLQISSQILLLKTFKISLKFRYKET